MIVLAEMLGLLLPLLALIGFLHAFDAVMRARTPQGAMAWVISLVALPYLAIPLYWIFGRSKFQEYIEILREAQMRHHGTLQRLRQQMTEKAAHLPQSIPCSQELIEKLAGFPFTTGNVTELLVDGEAAFAAIFDALTNAHHYIMLQSYILRDDRVGSELKRILIERARAGVKVYLLLDSVGALQLPHSYTEALVAAGVEVQFFRAGRRWFLSRFELNFRNHRKTVIVDGEVGFLGGLNFGDEYAGRSKRYGTWRDTHVRLRGPALVPQQVTFLTDWLWASGKELSELPTPQPQRDDNGAVCIVPSGPSDTHETVSLLYNHLISSARRRLWISSPYVVPDSAVMSALKMAALRGVEIRVLIPDTPDHLMAYLANFGFCHEAALAGIQVFRYTAGFLHQKAILVDQEVAVVGSANFDNRSFRLNFELSALVASSSFVAEVDQMMQRDFDSATQFSLANYQQRPFVFRAMVQMARLFAPVL